MGQLAPNGEVTYGTHDCYSTDSAVFVAAMLYSSVGQAGASGYLAAMALLGLAPSIMKPTALVLNILVASIATVKFYRAGFFSWSVFWPFAVTSVPFAFIGGSVTLPNQLYKVAVGIILLYAAYRLFRLSQAQNTIQSKPIPVIAALLSGGGIGLLSGITATGGGIFLSPLLLFMSWAETQQTSGVSAAFILLNSVAGLFGQLSTLAVLPNGLPVWLIAVGIGGWLGADFGSRQSNTMWLRQLLALVLVIAGVKLIFT